jgi:hypothetical protein
LLRIKAIKAIDDSGFAISFKHYDGLHCLNNYHKKESCPTKLEFVSARNLTQKWAILQTYEEHVVGRDPSPKIDGPEFTPSCFDDTRRSNSNPPYCAFFLDNSYGDQPTYDCIEPGEIIFKTVFTLMSNFSSKLDAFSSLYEASFGLCWGIKLDSIGNYTSIPCREMVGEEIEDILKVFRAEYKSAIFVINPTFKIL